MEQPELASARVQAVLVLMAGLALAFVLMRFPPQQYAIYPVCLFRLSTGWLCPGCGITRAAAALLHGHLQDAMHDNALVLLWAPLFVYAAWREARTVVRENRWLPTPIPFRCAQAVLIVAVLFGVARNLPLDDWTKLL
jgi:hypothetical protein